MTLVSLQLPFGERSLMVDGRRVPLARSLRVANHSPTGFSWGYEGSGCAQTALAILLAATSDKMLSLRHYQAFKREIVAPLAQNHGHVFEIDVRGWIAEQEAP